MAAGAGQGRRNVTQRSQPLLRGLPLGSCSCFSLRFGSCVAAAPHRALTQPPHGALCPPQCRLAPCPAYPALPCASSCPPQGALISYFRSSTLKAPRHGDAAPAPPARPPACKRAAGPGERTCFTVTRPGSTRCSSPLGPCTQARPRSALPGWPFLQRLIAARRRPVQALPPRPLQRACQGPSRPPHLDVHPLPVQRHRHLAGHVDGLQARGAARA